MTNERFEAQYLTFEPRFRTIWDLLNSTSAAQNTSFTEDFACFMQFYMVTFQRPSEISQMDASQLKMEKGLWNIPPKIKRYRHCIPLSPFAVSLIHRAIAIREDGHCDTIFPSAGIVSKRFRRLAARLLWKDIRLNDIRRNIRVRLLDAPLDIPNDAIELVLGHRGRISSERFPRMLRINQMRTVLRAWEDHLGDLTGDERLKHR